MVDDMSSHWVPERKRVNIEEPDERRFWMSVLEVDENELREAVGRVGTDPEAVREELERK